MQIKSFLLAALLLFSGVLAAQQKIAVVDMQKVFSGYDRTKTIELKINQQVDIYKQYAAGLMKEYQTLRAEFEKLRDESQNIALSESERENRRLRAVEKAEQVKRKENELEDYNKSRQKQMKEQFEKLRAEVLEEIKAVVKNKCVLEGWTMALDKSGVTMSELPLVIYNTPAVDLTQSVLEELNRAYRTGKKKNDKPVAK